MKPKPDVQDVHPEPEPYHSSGSPLGDGLEFPVAGHRAGKDRR
jgi:hypothetical protein